MKFLAIVGILLLLITTGCETTNTNISEQSKQEPKFDNESFKQKLSQLELGMSLGDFLKIFPDAKLQEHKIDTYENTGESFERRDYEFRYHSFVFADGKLNSYRNKLAF